MFIILVDGQKPYFMRFLASSGFLKLNKTLNLHVLSYRSQHDRRRKHDPIGLEYRERERKELWPGTQNGRSLS